MSSGCQKLTLRWHTALPLLQANSADTRGCTSSNALLSTQPPLSWLCRWLWAPTMLP
jgi:hypothetical protein